MALFAQSVMDAPLISLQKANKLIVCKIMPESYSEAMTNSMAVEKVSVSDMAGPIGKENVREIKLSIDRWIKIKKNGVPSTVILINTKKREIVFITRCKGGYLKRGDMIKLEDSRIEIRQQDKDNN